MLAPISMSVSHTQWTVLISMKWLNIEHLKLYSHSVVGDTHTIKWCENKLAIKCYNNDPYLKIEYLQIQDKHYLHKNDYM